MIDLVKIAQRRGLIPENIDPELEAADWLRRLAYLNASMKYEPYTLPITVHQFHAAESNEMPTKGWERLLPNSSLITHKFPGDHLSMMLDPQHRQSLGSKISHALPLETKFCEKKFDPLVFMANTSARETPLLLVPGAGASVTSFIGLLSTLQAEHPVYGLEPRGLDMRHVPHHSVAAAAKINIEAVRNNFTKGSSFHLIGHSYGGLVAFEMALQLADAGFGVSSLALIDTTLEDDENYSPDISDQELQAEFIEAISTRLGLSVEPRRNGARLSSRESFLKATHSHLTSINFLPVRSSAEILRGPLLTFSAACRTRYLPKAKFPGKLLVALAEISTKDELPNELMAAQRAKWDKYAAEADLVVVPGNHFTMLDAPNVNVLASWWERNTRHP